MIYFARRLDIWSIGPHLIQNDEGGHCKDCDETLPCLLQAFVPIEDRTL